MSIIVCCLCVSTFPFSSTIPSSPFSAMAFASLARLSALFNKASWSVSITVLFTSTSGAWMRLLTSLSVSIVLRSALSLLGPKASLRAVIGSPVVSTICLNLFPFSYLVRCSVVRAPTFTAASGI